MSETEGNVIVNDVFLDESFLEKLPKGWNYSKVRSYLTRVSKNPDNYTVKEIKSAEHLSKYLYKFYAKYHWIITPKEKDGLFSADRMDTMYRLWFSLWATLKDYEKENE